MGLRCRNRLRFVQNSTLWWSLGDADHGELIEMRASLGLPNLVSTEANKRISNDWFCMKIRPLDQQLHHVRPRPLTLSSMRPNQPRLAVHFLMGSFLQLPALHNLSPIESGLLNSPFLWVSSLAISDQIQEYMWVDLIISLELFPMKLVQQIHHKSGISALPLQNLHMFLGTSC